MKKCTFCGKPTARIEILDIVPDEFGLACSEPGVSTEIEIKGPICDDCYND